MTREDARKQFETMAMIRAYAKRLLAAQANDTSQHMGGFYFEMVERMYELIDDLITP